MADIEASSCGWKETSRSWWRRVFTKTRMCEYHARGMCRYGNDCAYAHSEADLQTRPDLYKTRVCEAFAAGKCEAADCNFAHGEAELRNTSRLPPASSKTAKAKKGQPSVDEMRALLKSMQHQAISEQSIKAIQAALQDKGSTQGREIGSSSTSHSNPISEASDGRRGEFQANPQLMAYLNNPAAAVFPNKVNEWNQSSGGAPQDSKAQRFGLLGFGDSILDNPRKAPAPGRTADQNCLSQRLQNSFQGQPERLSQAGQITQPRMVSSIFQRDAQPEVPLPYSSAEVSSVFQRDAQPEVPLPYPSTEVSESSTERQLKSLLHGFLRADGGSLGGARGQEQHGKMLQDQQSNQRQTRAVPQQQQRPQDQYSIWGHPLQQERAAFPIHKSISPMLPEEQLMLMRSNLALGEDSMYNRVPERAASQQQGGYPGMSSMNDATMKSLQQVPPSYPVRNHPGNQSHSSQRIPVGWSSQFPVQVAPFDADIFEDEVY